MVEMIRTQARPRAPPPPLGHPRRDGPSPRPHHRPDPRPRRHRRAPRQGPRRRVRAAHHQHAPAGGEVPAHVAPLPAVDAPRQPQPPHRHRVLRPRRRPPLRPRDPRRPPRAPRARPPDFPSPPSARTSSRLLGYTGGVVCVGIGGSLTSRPIDLLIIDDPYKDAKQADSKAWKQTVEDFWREVALPRLAPGAPVVLIQTRWREDDIAGWLQREFPEEWTVLNIAALADHDPAKGETDVLGRQPGEYMESARRRTKRDWEKKQREVGSRAWNALYQGRPAPAEGTIFKRTWWQRYDQPLWIEREDGSRVVTGFDDLLISLGHDLQEDRGHRLRVRAGVGPPRRRRVLARPGPRPDGLRGDPRRVPGARRPVAAGGAQGSSRTRRTGRPRSRCSAAPCPASSRSSPTAGRKSAPRQSPRWSSPATCGCPPASLAPWSDAVIEEAAGFPTAAHDDDVDALTQALNRLILQPLIVGDIVTEDDLLDDEDLSPIAPYL
ncbi:terminase [Nocardioides convexus]|uniref:terminase n=1 Tax=Nocardioides convexus TaxID=2712224 RepID=UPI0024181925|nr:terminase [Nocardioides convexus]